MSDIEALLEAIRKRDGDAARSLVERDPALVHARGENGATPVMTAVYHDAGSVLAMLIAHGAPLDLFAAAAVGHTERIVEILDAAPEQLHAHAPDGWTPLHLAAYFGQAAAVALLLARGADVQARSRNPTDNLPLHAALAGRHEPQVLDLLLAGGADANARAGAGVTPLHLAAARGAAAQVEHLLARGADADARMDDGATPADLAAARGFGELAAWLRRQSGAGAAGTGRG